jgi:hypothetical protein
MGGRTASLSGETIDSHTAGLKARMIIGMDGFFPNFMFHEL